MLWLVIESNFPGYKSDQLNDLEIRTVVDAMCVALVVKGGMDESKARVAFGEWQGKLHPEIGLAHSWSRQLEVLTF